MRRHFDPAEREIMDQPQPLSAALELDLRNLRQLNRFFGSYALVRHFLQRWIRPGASLRVIDLATGSGDIPRLVASYAREGAARLSAGFPEIKYHEGDIRSWGGANGYDIVLCSLVLHHFSE